MYQIGELVHYGSTGVCEIVDITMRAMPKDKTEQAYYILKPLYKECKISTPVENGKVFMRPIITKEEADRLIDTIPSVEEETYHSRAVRELTEYYEKALNTHDCADLIKLTKSIYAKKKHLEQQKRRFGTVDERYMKRAEDLLFGELAAALEIDRDSVLLYIRERIGDKDK